MFAPGAFRWVILAATLLAASLSHASPAFEALLKQADKVRTADPVAFERLLKRLNSDQSQATASQRELLSFFNAYANAYAGRYDRAVADASRLAANATDLTVRYRAGILVVNSLAATRQFTDGLRQLQETLALEPQIQDQDVRQQGLGVATVIYNQVGQHGLAREYADQILAAPASDRTRCFVGMLRIEALHNLRRLPPDDLGMIEVIDDCTRQNEAVWANFARLILVRRWADQGRRAEAIAMLREHAAEIRSTRYPRLIGEAESLLGELLMAEGDARGAGVHAGAAIRQSVGIASSPPLVSAYKVLYDIAEKKGDLAESLKYYRLYAEAERAYLNDVKARELAYQLVSHETMRKTQQISLLNRRNQVLELQQRVDRQAKQNTQLLAGFLALLVATIGYWAWKMKRVQGSFRRLAETDMLTGISNRHHFTRKAEEALEYCRRNIEDVGLILFDLDHFKSINDRFGHIVGDFVLIRVAEVCKASCRKNDRFARIGGEEFAILLVGCDLEATARMAQVFCRQIASIDTGACGHQFPVTASFGVTTASQSGYELSRMMSHADQMLYRSKNEGRNQVQVAGSDERPYQRVPEEQRELFTTTAA